MTSTPKFVVGQRYMLRRDLRPDMPWRDSTNCGDIGSRTFKERLCSGPFSVDNLRVRNARVTDEDLGRRRWYVSPDWIDWTWTGQITSKQDIEELYA